MGEDDRCADWSVRTLKEFVLHLLEEREYRYSQRFDSQNAALSKAERAAEKRFEGMNEFRAAMGDQQRTMMPRAEAEIRLKAIEDRMSQSSGIGVGWTYAIAAMAVIVSIVAVAIALTK